MFRVTSMSAHFIRLFEYIVQLYYSSARLCMVAVLTQLDLVGPCHASCLPACAEYTLTAWAIIQSRALVIAIYSFDFSSACGGGAVR